MKFKALNGYVGKDSSFISITIENGNNSDSIGDQLWISPCGTMLEITDLIDEDTFREAVNLFNGQSSCMAFKGAMRRMGVYFD